MQPTIENCSFRFECPMKWDTLLETSNPKIRYCPECDRGVHLCETDAELETAMDRGWCVAIDQGKDLMAKTIGDIDPNVYFEEK